MKHEKSKQPALFSLTKILVNFNILAEFNKN